MSTTTTFPGSDVRQLRELAEKARRMQSEGLEGWSKSEVDPMELLSTFPSLHLKVGLVLRAYQFRSCGNGNGIVLAMPEDLPFPEPDECLERGAVFLGPPRPPRALDNFMDAIKGDGTLWSYLSASIFAREAAEFGAIWHGSSWSTHVVLGSDPNDSPRHSDQRGYPDEPSKYPGAWRWLEPKPSEWMPGVCEGSNVVTVMFYTFSGLGCQAIYRHTDTYKLGQYRFESDRKVIAKGPAGFIF
jgi:hypothetical protein